MFKETGAESTALGYFGYPGHICVSVNDEVVHGIPGQRKIKRGDLVKCDVAARYRGYVGGHARTASPSAVSRRWRRERATWCKVTREALFRGIQQACAGNRLSDIGAAIEEHVKRHGMSVVRDFVGHGVGRNMHEAPQVQHHGPPGRGPILRPGHVPGDRAAGQSRLARSAHARRRLDRRHRRRQPERALRAHRRHYRRRAARS